MAELDSLSVHLDSLVGWDERASPNETSDDDGIPGAAVSAFAKTDPGAPQHRVWDDPEVQALRKHLQSHNGIHGLEICSPDEVERAARLFHRDGFVVVRDLLSQEQLSRQRAACTRTLKELLSEPGYGGRKYHTESGRTPHRYSYGECSASRHMLHDPAWASLVDLPTTTPLLTKLFGSLDYLVLGAGGDLCLPGTIEYQHLHRDVQDNPQKLGKGRLEMAGTKGIRSDPEKPLGLTKQKLIYEMTPPIITINFLMSDQTWENGPIRHIPGTHGVQQHPPTLSEEPAWMKLMTIVGAPAGAGVFRDNRAWHGGTPNLSRQVRAMPNVEYAAPYAGKNVEKSMPHEIWASLSPHGQHICRLVKANRGIWPTGAGIVHAIASKRGRKTMPSISDVPESDRGENSVPKLSLAMAKL
eukprot:gnl/TRDRNA2_/TRDRNA2_88090_c0_seq1.p1 gnl/TRDRNA2_/TRDRNA2_88090_c0~~gnl/TRDRNA2_/TRDRNA2_88090_c0_seq1.p1  ORF type:complete len:413 (-),score=49.52 gnl/TRDRNA2_/TRDRNA2_88090_c0_seq1:46-1284(-)